MKVYLIGIHFFYVYALLFFVFNEMAKTLRNGINLTYVARKCAICVLNIIYIHHGQINTVYKTNGCRGIEFRQIMSDKKRIDWKEVEIVN